MPVLRPQSFLLLPLYIISEVLFMGKVRDFFKELGIFGSASTTVSSAGQKLLNLRNEFDKLEEKPKKKAR